MKRAKGGLVQGQLFGSRTAAERFRVDDGTGLVTRVVTLRDPDAVPVVTEIGTWDRNVPLDDVRAVADLSYLQRTAPPAANDGPEVRVADLFSGCGAMSLGVLEACRAVGRKFVPAGAFDINQRVLDVYTRNFGTPIQAAVDLSEVLSDDLESEINDREAALIESLGNVDFAVAGPPCQGHSNLNNRTRRNDPKNALYFLVARFAKLFRPRWILIENVVSVLHDKGDVVHRTQVALEGMGYETSDGIVDLWSIGVAQTRRRHIMVAQLRDPEDVGPRILPYLADLITPYATRPRAVRWAIEDLLNVAPDSFMDQPRRPDEITQGRIDYLFDHGLHELPKSQRPASHKGEHGDSYKAVYGRMRWDDPAPTLTSGFSTMGQGRFVHSKRRRTITPHEAARVQFIPDFFDFSPISDNKSILTDTIGNAVPPKLSYVLALELLR
jgi:DNA (cytosine-5)-methyltransferase 1